MSFEGIGGLVALAGLAVYGVFKVTTYVVKGAAQLLYHGGKAAVHGTRAAAAGAKSAASAIREAHAAAEEKRREEALAELRSMDGVMARSTESLMADIRRAEAAAEADRRSTAAAMDKRWAEALSALESKAERADEAMLALREFHTQKSVELAEGLRTETAALESRLTTAVSDLSDKTVSAVSASTKAAMKALEDASATVEERTARYEAYARQALTEAQEMLAWIEKHYDCETFAPAQLIAARAKVKSTVTALADGAFKNAAGFAAQTAEEVQMLLVHAEQRTAAFNRAKAALQSAAAELMDMTEASRTLITEGDPEELAAFVSEEYDVDFWSEGRLKALWDRAAQLQAQADALAYNSGYSDAADEIAVALAQTRQALMDEYTRTRLHLVSRNDIVRLAQTIIESHEENGWEMSESPAYTQNDPRSALHLVFTRRGDQRDVFIRNVYDPASGMYKQQIVRHVEEAGMPDETQRRNDDNAINQSMSDRGIVDDMHVKCDMATAGLKAPQ